MEDIFKGTTVLITGASSGFGELFARQLAARGAGLILVARSADKLAALARELSTAHGIPALDLPADLGKPADGADRLCDEIERRGLEVQHLVSNAGFGLAGPFGRIDAARQAEMVRLNCDTVTILARRLLPAMIRRRAGGLIHLASTAAFQAVPGMAVYAASKAYVLSLTIALAEELRGTGVRVTALCPGPVPTGFQGVAGLGIEGAQNAVVVPADQVVRQALRAYERGKPLYVPGILNRMGTLGTRLFSRPRAARMAHRLIGKPEIRTD